MTDSETAELRRMIDDIVNVTGTDVQERREAIAHTWINTFLNRGAEEERQKDMRHRRDYQAERDVEHLIMMSAVVASGLSNQTGTSGKSIAARSIEIAKAILTQLREGK